MSGPVISIDGPAGAGKSTTARLLAQRLGFDYIDTGAMYRAVALAAHRSDTDLHDDAQIDALLGRLDLRVEVDVSIGQQRVYIDGDDVTAAIRTEEIDRLVSAVAAHPRIRKHMVQWQRTRASRGRVVIEGRDIGTVVCPEADVKIYLDADLSERAARRVRERGEHAAAADTLTDLARRDRADMGREHGPLRRADDAIVVDTTNLTIEQQVETVYRICVERLQNRGTSGS